MLFTLAAAATVAYIATWRGAPAIDEIWSNPFALPRRASSTDINAGLAIWLVTVPTLAYLLVQQLGYRSFAGSRGLARATRRMEAIKSGTATLVSASIDVWKCSNENWQSIVEHAVVTSDIVLVDLSEVNENIRWEIDTTRRLKSPADIVWTAARGSRIDRKLIEEICNDYECPSGDVETLARNGWLFVYPAQPLQNALPRHYFAQAEGLRALLLGRVT